MKQEIVYEGIGMSGTDILIYFTLGSDLAKRFRSVKVPIDEFRHDEIGFALNAAANRRLKAAWEGDEPFDLED